ncbi:MAG: hypothetical protein JXA95_00955 [Spirochaetales bacterium]|nr:hypothetical protein [Spirochaetales bacterium]
MSDNPLSQNEMFQLLGNFPSRPCAKLESAGPALTGKEQLALLKEISAKGNPSHG